MFDLLFKTSRHAPPPVGPRLRNALRTSNMADGAYASSLWGRSLPSGDCRYLHLASGAMKPSVWMRLNVRCCWARQSAPNHRPGHDRERISVGTQLTGSGFWVASNRHLRPIRAG